MQTAMVFTDIHSAFAVPYNFSLSPTCGFAFGHCFHD